MSARRGPTEQYVRDYTLRRQQLRPTYGEGSDCSDLMNVALARLVGLIKGDLTPTQILDAIEESQ